MNPAKAKKMARLARIELGHQNDTPAKPKHMAKLEATPKQPRLENCGCQKRWNLVTKQYEGYSMCVIHAQQFKRIITTAAQKLKEKQAARATAIPMTKEKIDAMVNGGAA